MANNIIIHARLAAEPDLRYTSDGKAMCKMRLPVYAGKNKDGGYNPSLWFHAVVWDHDAEVAAEFYHKGDNVVVEGYLGYEEWEKKDGTKQGSYTINKPIITKV